jgi:hypothetical protein
MTVSEEAFVLQLTTLRHQVVQSLGDAESSNPMYPMIIPHFERRRAERICFLVMNLACGSIDFLPPEEAAPASLCEQLTTSYATEILALRQAIEEASQAGVSDERAGHLLVDIFVRG